MQRDVKVSGGYRLGDDAALPIEACNRFGRVERGAADPPRRRGLDLAGTQTVSCP